MNTAVTVICCLIPCIGMVVGVMLLQKAKKKAAKETDTAGPMPQLMKRVGTRILIVAAVLLAVTVLALMLVPMNTAKFRLITAILLVTVQYGAAMVLIFVVSGMLQKDKKQRNEMQKKENT